MRRQGRVLREPQAGTAAGTAAPAEAVQAVVRSRARPQEGARRKRHMHQERARGCEDVGGSCGARQGSAGASFLTSGLAEVLAEGRTGQGLRTGARKDGSVLRSRLHSLGAVPVLASWGLYPLLGQRASQSPQMPSARPWSRALCRGSPLVVGPEPERKLGSMDPGGRARAPASLGPWRWPLSRRSLPIGEENSNPNLRNPESPKEFKPNSKHPKTHINQRNIKHKDKY